MCRAVPCKTCRKITWSGCGQHVNQVRSGVPTDQWCPGHPHQSRSSSWWQHLTRRA